MGKMDDVFLKQASQSSVHEGEETPEQKKERLIKQLASLLHDEWRAPRKKDDGTFEPRIKVFAKTEKGEKWFDENKVPSEAQELKKQDIANTPFESLDPDWQYENGAAAEVAINEIFKAVENNQSFNDAFIEEASAVVHDKWLERNNWVYNPDYGNPDLAKPYKELSEEEKEKDRAQIKKAIDIYNSVK